MCRPGCVYVFACFGLGIVLMPRRVLPNSGEVLRELVPALFAEPGDLFNLFVHNSMYDHPDSIKAHTIVVVFEGKSEQVGDLLAETAGETAFHFRIHTRNSRYQGPRRYWYHRRSMIALFGENIIIDRLPFTGGDLAEESQKELSEHYRLKSCWDKVFMKCFVVKEAALPLFRKATESDLDSEEDAMSGDESE